MARVPHSAIHKVVYLRHLPRGGAGDDILQKYETKDGLIRAVDLETEMFFDKDAYTLQRIYRLKHEHGNIHLYPYPEIWGVLDYIVEDERMLWPMSAIKLSTVSWGRKSAPIYGVNFSQAVAIASKKGFIKSRFQIETPERFKTLGVLTDLLVHLGRNKQTEEKVTLELQAWQGIQHASEVFYIHGILEEDGSSFNHLDGALIEFDDDSLKALFNSGRKVKGTWYEKLFRLDGEIPVKLAFNIVRQFLPTIELTDEFFWRLSRFCVSGDNQPSCLERRPDYATDPSRTPRRVVEGL